MYDKYPVKAICDTMDINKSGYYKWLNRQKNFNLSPQKKLRAERMSLFKEYGNKYRTHGYKWLNAKIKLDKEEFKCSDETARQICKFLGIKSISKHEKQKYRKPRKDAKNYQNYNKKLYENGFIYSMSAPGRSTENGAKESINGWVKEELLRDFMIDELDTFEKSLEKYIYYFNYERPAAALNYLTPIQYKQKYYIDNSIK